ncbi:hypothetical protein [Flavobacterium panacagri]|uniref:hypothetical protein n=1 Tax=Flavobacterium panacagri TaxID=3034146 RepID=UPI0025A683DE|nr:hypothetical protein [Flavobacterium panacagri]
MQSLLQNLKNAAFLDNKITPQFSKEFPEIISAEVYIDPIPLLAKKKAINYHKLNSGNEILYFSEKKWEENNGKSTLTSIVITTEFISAHWSVSNEINVYYFKDISSIEYDSTLYHFFDINNEEIGGIFNFFAVVNNYDDAPIYFTDELVKLIKYHKGRNETLEKLNNLNKSYIDFKNNHSQKEMLELAEKDFSNQVLILYDQFTVQYGKNNMPIDLKYYEFLAYQGKSEFKKALEITDYVLKNYTENTCLWYELKAATLNKLGNTYQAIIYYNKASLLSLDSQQKLKFRDITQTLQNDFNKIFITLPYHQRKLILIDSEFKSTPEETFIVLEKNNLPLNIQFPNNNPKKEELYILHPYIKDIYMPFSDYEVILFRDKFEEFSYLIQCLGAKKMTIKVAKESKNSRSNLINLTSNINSEKSVDGAIGINGFGIKGSNKSTKNNETDFSSDQDQIKEDDTYYSRTQIFNPTKKPYLPLEMIWYENESTWQRLYKQRITGNIKHHHDILNSKSTYSISEKENTSLKEAYTNYISAEISYLAYSASGSLNTEKNKNISKIVESTFNQNDSIEWDIEIEFESIENLTEVNELENQFNPSTAIISTEEEYYKEEIKFMLEDDGIIDDKERSILERLRVKLNLSPENALKIENEVRTGGNLTDDEKEYLEAFQEMKDHAEITDKERKILNRFASLLNIPVERLIQLESILK